MQKTMRVKHTKYHTTAVPSGVVPIFSESIFASVQSTRPFGSWVELIKALLGRPKPCTWVRGINQLITSVSVAMGLTAVIGNIVCYLTQLYPKTW
ncbi:hypothetical protein GQ44DRAFT_346162 [Phaeosphaeriaceae sp. PMI808]|nr:hypothetical protein GQ44DRAFT_346162 [Phaeosphaeriaceae sp. PMI808]